MRARIVLGGGKDFGGEVKVRGVWTRWFGGEKD
jgi:hypothetical protein